MKEDAKKQIFAGIDIGTTKVCAIIAEWSEDKPIKILGIGQSQSVGLNRGIVNDINETVSAIEKAVLEAESQSGYKIESAYVGITGEHIRGINNTGVVTVSKTNTRIPTDQEITENDIQRVLDHAQSITLPQERRILHILSQEFKIDDHSGIKNPLGMSGHRLEARVHLVTSGKTVEKNLKTCMDKAGIEVTGFVLEPLASAFALLDPNEKKLGVALLDIGGGTTDVIVYYDNGVHHTGVIPFGGNSITNDIAHGVQTTVEQAEELKCKYGSCKGALASEEELISIKGIGGRGEKTMSPRKLASFIEPRMKEIFTFANSEIHKSDYRGSFTFGIVITGGGSLLNNVEDLAQEIFRQPIKIGIPTEVDGIADKIQDPIYSTAVGLIHYAIYNRDAVEDISSWGNGFPIIGKIINKIKNFFGNLY